MDRWTEVLADIVTRKVEELDLENADRAEMHTRISTFLYKVIDEFEERFYQDNAKGVSGWVKSGVASVTGTFEKLRKDVPTFTEQILDFLNEEGNREAIKGFVIDKLNEYADNTFAQTDYTSVDAIVAEHEQEDALETALFLERKVDGLASSVMAW